MQILFNFIISSQMNGALSFNTEDCGISENFPIKVEYRDLFIKFPYVQNQNPYSDF